VGQQARLSRRPSLRTRQFRNGSNRTQVGPLKPTVESVFASEQWPRQWNECWWWHPLRFLLHSRNVKNP
jgi:hypothetical protein